MKDLHSYITSYFGVDAQDLDIISNLFEVQEIEKDAFYLRKNQIAHQLSFIQSGFLRIYTEHNDKEVTQWISSKGYFVTDLNSFIFKQRARWNIQALSHCIVYSISTERYKRLNELIPNWPTMEKQFIAGCFVMLEDRVFSHLSLSAEKRYDRLFQMSPELFNNVPMQYLASMLGMTPETFSRIRSKRVS